MQLLNQSGEVTKTYEYDSFGNEVNPDKDDDNPFRYSGEYYDKETESIYLRARYYQPSVGRFLTRDTYTGEDDDPLSLNLYTYCGNDGVNNVDPSGHDAAALNRTWTGSMWWLCGVDGAIPVGDVIYGIGVVGTGAWAVGEAIFLKNDLSLTAPDKQEIKVNYQKVCHRTYIVSKVKLTIPRTLSRDIKIGKPKAVYNQNQKVYRYRVTTRPMYQSQLTSEIAQIARANANGKSKARADAKPSIKKMSQSNGKSGKGSKTTREVKIPKNVERQMKKLSREAIKGFEKCIEALKSGDTRGLNDHPLSGARSGQRALDIKGTGKGRGAGRVVYEYVENGVIKIIEIITNHKY